jgi:hypothetical protein
MPRRAWTKSELDRAYAMRGAGHSYDEIDKSLGRRAGATRQKLHIARHGHRIPNNLLDERDALIAARNRRALTQDFFGDPPPGYSALYGKTGLR